MKKTLVRLWYLGDYTTQVYRIMIPMNQPVEWKVGGFFRGSFDKNHLNKTTCQDPAKDILLELVGEKKPLEGVCFVGTSKKSSVGKGPTKRAW